MRRIAMAGAMLALTLGAAPMLSAQQPKNSQAPEQHQTMRHGPRHHGDRAPMRAAFRGIELTAQQKAQIKAIHERYQPQYKALREQLKPVAQQRRAERQKGDKDAAKAAFEKTKGQRDQLRVLSQKEMSDVRGVLTAPQQAQFDKNVGEMKEHMQKRMEQWKKNGAQRHQKPGSGTGF